MRARSVACSIVRLTAVFRNGIPIHLYGACIRSGQAVRRDCAFVPVPPKRLRKRLPAVWLNLRDPAVDRPAKIPGIQFPRVIL